jgi:hypothetical protein
MEVMQEWVTALITVAGTLAGGGLGLGGALRISRRERRTLCTPR